MPFYDYACSACGTTFEAMRKIEERDNPIICPECGEVVNNGQKIGANQAWVLKGSGWGPRYWSEYNRQKEVFRRRKKQE